MVTAFGTSNSDLGVLVKVPIGNIGICSGDVVTTLDIVDGLGSWNE